MADVFVHVNRNLERPQFCSIEPAALAALDPLLMDIPVAYIRQQMGDVGPELFEGMNNATAVAITTDELPTHLQVIWRDPAVETVTHIIAAYSDTCRVSNVTLFPVHALALVPACANLPILPPSAPNLMEGEETVTVPVIPVKIPSVTTFRLLLPYLYTNRCDGLLSGLLPFEDDGDEPYRSIGIRHAKSFSVPELLHDASKIHALWCNAVALGMFDEELYNTLEMAWEVCMVALSDGHKQAVTNGVDLAILP